MGTLGAISVKFGGSKELLEILVTEVTEKAVKPLAVYKSRGFIFWSFSAIMAKLLRVRIVPLGTLKNYFGGFA